MNDLTGSSIHVPIIDPQKNGSAITVKLLKTDGGTPETKTREIAPWMDTAGHVQKG